MLADLYHHMFVMGEFTHTVQWVILALGHIGFCVQFDYRSQILLSE